MILPLRIKNSEILPSPFTISKVLYGNDRANPFNTKNKNGNNSLDLLETALFTEFDINGDITEEENNVEINPSTIEESNRRPFVRVSGKCTYSTSNSFL